MVQLSNGAQAQLVEVGDGWALEIDGVRQSHVGPRGEPPALASVRWMLAAVTSLTESANPLRFAHLGGGLLTLPRAVADRYPHSRQVVVELDAALADLARGRFGLPQGVELIVGDARAWLQTTTTPERPTGYDAIVIDVFAGGRIPPAFTSRECFAQAASLLNPTGLLVLNSVAGPDLQFTRRELATMQSVFSHVAMIVQGSALKGLRFGNATLIGSHAPLSVDAIRTALAGDPSKGALVTDLADIVDGAAPVSDADRLWSPMPDLPNYDATLRAIDAMRKTVTEALGGAASDSD